MEKWDVYNSGRKRTGRTLSRGGALGGDEYHLAVHICIFDSSGHMLIQQRQPFKADWPGMWDLTVGGCALSGENSTEAAERELFEELGVKVDFSSERSHLTVNFERGFDDYYIIVDDIDISALILQPEEVKAVRWAEEQDVLALIEDGKFIPYRNGIIEFLFDLRRHRGSHSVL